MTIPLIILAYVVNVFVNRLIDWIICKLFDKDPVIFLWYWSLIGTIILLVQLACFCFAQILGEGNIEKFKSWFTGKHW